MHKAPDAMMAEAEDEAYIGMPQWTNLSVTRQPGFLRRHQV
jgi:hypothetical protein